MLPWTDRTGRFAPLKCAAFAGVLVPAAWIVIEASFGWLGERPIMEAIHQSGLWAVRLLAVTLAVTPLRLALRWPKLISIRRILGNRGKFPGGRGSQRLESVIQAMNDSAAA